MNLAFPYRLDETGRIAVSDDETHVRDMIEQVLFTASGERVNRPGFGTDMMRMIFAPNRLELAGTLQVSLQASLQQYLGDVIDVGAVEVAVEDATFQVSVRYVLRATGREALARFGGET